MSTELLVGSIGAIIAFLVFILTIASFLWMARNDYRHLDAKIDANHKETYEMMKDFHGRLEKQDAEFKCFMKQEEEKRTRIIMERK